MALIVRTVTCLWLYHCWCKANVPDLQLKGFAQEIAQTHAKPHRKRAFGGCRCELFTTCLGSIPLNIQEPARRDGPCLCILPLSWGKPRSRAALPPVLQRDQLLSEYCTDIPAAGVQVTTAERGPRLSLFYGRCHYGIGRDEEPLGLDICFWITSSEGILRAAGI